MQDDINDTSGSFRDRVVTMNAEGKRNWIYANKPKGTYYNARTWVSTVLLAFFFLAPHIKVGDEALLLFDILHRKFVLFGVVFWPQDFHLFVIGMITIIVTIVLFTVVYGRIWCGWTCPQTIFMEMVFRKIEFLVEGNGVVQKQRKRNGDKNEILWRASLKHTLFILVSLIITHTMLCYIVGADVVKGYLLGSPSDNVSVFLAMMILTGAFYFVFAYFREQVCSLVCPYGRFQGALLDANTLMVTYDFKRGEQRGPIKKGEDRFAAGKGDCINCGKCTTVCPTGLDIRNGIQLECINCTSCMDACNSVMTKLGKPKGLVRITSQNNVTEGTTFQWSPRIVAYTALLVTLLGVLVVLFSLRSNFETTILRVQGTLYQDLGNDTISNIYNYKIVNKTNTEKQVAIRLLSPQGAVKLAGNDLLLKKQSKLEGAFLLEFDKKTLTGSNTIIILGIYHNNELVEEIQTTFVGPDKRDK